MQFPCDGCKNSRNFIWWAMIIRRALFLKDVGSILRVLDSELVKKLEINVGGFYCILRFPIVYLTYFHHCKQLLSVPDLFLHHWIARDLLFQIFHSIWQQKSFSSHRHSDIKFSSRLFVVCFLPGVIPSFPTMHFTACWTFTSVQRRKAALQDHKCKTVVTNIAVSL